MDGKAVPRRSLGPEPATLRYQILPIAARVARRGRDLHMRIDETWPWRDQLDAAFGRLRSVLC